jgi:hypothetical protein
MASDGWGLLRLRLDVGKGNGSAEAASRKSPIEETVFAPVKPLVNSPASMTSRRGRRRDPEIPLDFTPHRRCAEVAGIAPFG